MSDQPSDKEFRANAYTVKTLGLVLSTVGYLYGFTQCIGRDFPALMLITGVWLLVAHVLLPSVEDGRAALSFYSGKK